MLQFNYKRLSYDFPFTLQDADNFENVKLLEHLGPANSDTVLFVLDYVPTDDIINGKILSGEGKEFLLNLLAYSKKLYDHKPFTWYATAFHVCRTIGTTREFQERAFEAFHDRLLHIIQKIKPNKIILFGKHQFEALCPEENDKCSGMSKIYIGNPIKKTLKLPRGKHEATITRLPSITGMLAGKEDVYLAGYVARSMANALAGKNLFTLEKPDFKIHLVDTMKKFDRLMDLVINAKVVSIDTEDDNLNRIVNRVLTVQFSVDKHNAYILPYCHRDSPFSSRELRYIAKRLRDYFETSTNDYNIYMNAQYDLCTMRSQFGIRFYNAPIWDVAAGEYLIDENLVGLGKLEGTDKKRGGSYFGLMNIAGQYGNFSYMEAKFSKSDRENIKNMPLNDDVLYYCGLDTIIPWLIHEKQQEKAKVINYRNFVRTITRLQSDVIHSIHGLEYVGYKIDIAYLFRMKMPDSPINVEIQKNESAILETELGKKANALLLEKEGLPTRGLFSEQKNMLSMSKPDHQVILFIDAAKLKPINKGAKGRPKIDSEFQKEYKNIPIVELYTKWKKALKLRDAYVNQMLKHWGTQEDFKRDMRIRCRFDYMKITGRLSASNPSLQNIPSRGDMSKFIKRMFIAEVGTVIVKVDYRVHEVRGWGIISGDKAVARAFQLGKDLIDAYKLRPNRVDLERIDTDGDIHKVNACFFFSKKINKVTKVDRENIKGVVFGLIYGKSDSTLSRDIKQELVFTQNLIAAFMKRFPVGSGWFDKIETQARKHYFLESPLGRRRNLFGYMLSNKTKDGRRAHGDMNRRARNSPIQGMCSDFMMIGARNLQKAVWNHYQKTGYLPNIRACVSVHDSLECEVGYEDLLMGINFIEKSLTEQVQKECKERFGLDFVSDLMLDFEIGPSGDTLKKWKYEVEGYSYKKMVTEKVKLENGKEEEREVEKDIKVFGIKDIVKMSLEFQENELGYEQDKKALYKSVFKSDTARYMPKWMKQQISLSQ